MRANAPTPTPDRIPAPLSQGLIDDIDTPITDNNLQSATSNLSPDFINHLVQSGLSRSQIENLPTEDLLALRARYDVDNNPVFNNLEPAERYTFIAQHGLNYDYSTVTPNDIDNFLYPNG
jgi:hypothetical protein